MAGPIISGLIFSAIVILLSFLKPNVCRIFLGFFFIVMGGGVNLTFIMTQPFFVYEYGMGAWLPLYRELTESIIGLSPQLFGVLLILFEIVMGIFLLSKGPWVKTGIIGISLFILLLIPLYSSQIAWAVSLFGIIKLLNNVYDRTILEMIKTPIGK